MSAHLQDVNNNKKDRERFYPMKYFRIFSAFKPIGLNSMMMKWVSFSIKFWKPLRVSFLLHCFSVYQILSPMNIEFDTKKESDSPSECTRRLGLYFLHRQGTPQVKEMVSSKPISTEILKMAKKTLSPLGISCGRSDWGGCGSSDEPGDLDHSANTRWDSGSQVSFTNTISLNVAECQIL